MKGDCPILLQKYQNDQACSQQQAGNNASQVPLTQFNQQTSANHQPKVTFQGQGLTNTVSYHTHDASDIQDEHTNKNLEEDTPFFAFIVRHKFDHDTDNKGKDHSWVVHNWFHADTFFQRPIISHMI